MVITKQFPGGLRLVVNKMEGLYSVSMGILVGTGSCFESAEENGISHFIEHMMFKGTHKRTAFEISDAMDRIGAQVNAFTSKDITCYYAKSTYDHAEEAFEILADFFSDSVFPEEETRHLPASDQGAAGKLLPFACLAGDGAGPGMGGL